MVVWIELVSATCLLAIPAIKESWIFSSEECLYCIGSIPCFLSCCTVYDMYVQGLCSSSVICLQIMICVAYVGAYIWKKCKELNER